MPAAEEYRVAATNIIGTGPSRASPIRATRIDVVGPDAVSENTRYSAAFTPADTTYQDVTWTVTEPAGRADLQVADIDAGLLKVNTRSGQVLVTAVDENGVRGSKLVTVEGSTRRENAARWPGVTVTASSIFGPAFAADRVRDGLGGGDWASAGEQDPWVELTWPEPISADRVVLYDRTSGDDANGGVLEFSDGSTVPVTGIPGNGDAKQGRFRDQDV